MKLTIISNKSKKLKILFFNSCVHYFSINSCVHICLAREKDIETTTIGFKGLKKYTTIFSVV